MPITTAGCVVCGRDDAGQLSVLLIHHRQGVWTLPKGHIEDGETETDAVRREVFEKLISPARLGHCLAA